MGAYFAERAAELAEHVVYAKETASSAVFWGKPGQILTSAPGIPLLTATAPGDPAPPPEPLLESDGGRWVLLSWFEDEHQRQPEWLAAFDGGGRTSSCDGVPYRELIVGATLRPGMAGAAVFDLDGILAGLVIRCADSLHVAQATSFPDLLKAFALPEKRLRARYGLAVTPQEKGGLFIEAIDPEGRAYAAGLRAGQTLPTPATAAELWDELEAGAVDTRPAPPSAGFGVDLLPPTVLVRPGSPAAALGLRTGDRLIQPAQLYQWTTPRRGRAVFVFERDGWHFAKEVTR